MDKERKRKLKKKGTLFLIVLFVLIQFFRIDKEAASSPVEKDFLINQSTPEKTASIIKKSCYDCHSNTTKYPWYSNLAPISWWIKHHVNEGKEHLNFSVWTDYTAKKAAHKLEECLEVLEEEEMPLKTYTLIHHDTKLTPEDKKRLINYFKTILIGD
jgi:hypothetical protein